MKKPTLQEKIDRAKPGDTIWHVVEDPNPLVLMEKPVVTRGWMNDLIGFAVVAAGTGDYKPLSKKLKELGVKVIDD